MPLPGPSTEKVTSTSLKRVEFKFPAQYNDNNSHLHWYRAVNSQISLYVDTLHTVSADLARSGNGPAAVIPLHPAAAPTAPLRSSLRQRDRKGLHNSVGFIVTVALHVIVLLVMLSSRLTTEVKPMPISARVLSDTVAEQPKEEIKEVQPVLEKSRLNVPQPEIILPTTEPAPTAPVAITQAAPKREEAPKQVVDSVPRFDADYLDNPKPAYPPLSRRLREEGVVLIRVHVLPSGLPDAVVLKRSSGSARLDESALAAVRRWKFVPATTAGNAVAAWVVVPIAFSLNT